MPKRRKLAALAAASALGALALPAAAIDLRPDAVEVIAGPGKNGTAQVGAGLVWDWGVRLERRALITAQTELILSHWRYDALGGGKDDLQQVTLLPLMRMQLDRGSSPFFLELGVGATYLSQNYLTPRKNFSTRWNFYDVLGGGYRFGQRGEHELGLRLLHISNAGIEKPNPGEEFLLLRYAYKF